MKINPIHVYSLLIVIFLGIIGTSVYYLLGGFREVHIFQMEGEKRLMAGRQFSGRQTSDVRNQYFAESRTLIQDSLYFGTLAVVNYTHDSLRPNELSQFIGFILPDTAMGEAPVGYEVREYVSESRLVIFLGMHWLVKPGPNKIEKWLHQRADELGIDLQEFFFEIYYMDDSMSVEAWSRD